MWTALSSPERSDSRRPSPRSRSAARRETMNGTGPAKRLRPEREKTDAPDRDGTAGFRQGRPRQAARGRDRRGRRGLLRARPRGQAGRPDQGIRAGEGPAGPSARRFQGSGDDRRAGGVQRGPDDHGVRERLRAGSRTRHADAWLDLFPPVASAAPSRAVGGELADHHGLRQVRDSAGSIPPTVSTRATSCSTGNARSVPTTR